MKKILSFIVCLFFASAIFAGSVKLNYTYKNKKIETKVVSLEKIDADTERLVIKKESISEDVAYIDVVHTDAIVPVGTQGWWTFARGVYGNFDQSKGTYIVNKSYMPIFAVKTDKTTFWTNIKTLRFFYDFCVISSNGTYKVFPRFRIDKIRQNFDIFYI